MATCTICKSAKSRQDLPVGNMSGTYNRSDFLSAAKLATKLGISKETAEQAIKDLKFKRASFLLKGRVTPVVCVTQHKRNPVIHPMAISVVQDFISSQKAKK